MAKGKWTSKKLLKVVPCCPCGFFYNPLAWSQENLGRCVREAKKKGLVTTRYWSKDQIEVLLIKQ